MNSSITQNNEKENINTKRYLPHDIKTKIHAVEMYRNCGDIEYTCRKYHISRQSLWRWNKKYDGTQKSLEERSHKPKKRHPNADISNLRKQWRRLGLPLEAFDFLEFELEDDFMEHRFMQALLETDIMPPYYLAEHEEIQKASETFDIETSNDILGNKVNTLDGEDDGNRYNNSIKKKGLIMHGN